jgi:predicted NAD-dependent protein-ADP-ribosyltransferase YbiA (DUF1768 family)
MRVLLKEKVMVVIPQSTDEDLDVENWKPGHGDHVFCLRVSQDRSLELHDLGERVEACREPINVVSTSPDPIARLISNLASTPFQFDDQHYQSVESFWQGLKFPSDGDRRHVAQLEGARARSEGEAQGYGPTVSYGGKEVVVGTWAHWQLMEQACRAKFQQNKEAQVALLATGGRPLMHKVRRDSRAIPGVIMAEIWMRIRKGLRLGNLSG